MSDLAKEVGYGDLLTEARAKSICHRRPASELLPLLADEIDAAYAALQDIEEIEGGKFWFKEWQAKHGEVIARAKASPTETKHLQGNGK